MTCFDLELPEDFTPCANDGEVHSFELWPVQRVFETVRDSTAFKYNCNLVLIDFFVRHGLLSADDPQFVAIRSGLKMMYTLPNGIGSATARREEYVAGSADTSTWGSPDPTVRA